MLSFPQDSSQIGLLKELLDLQKDMVVMLLSLLEGGVPLLSCVPPTRGVQDPSAAMGAPMSPCHTGHPHYSMLPGVRTYHPPSRIS